MQFFFINRQGEDLEIDYDSLAAAVEKQFNIQKEEKKQGNSKAKPQESKIDKGIQIIYLILILLIRMV